jgi:hypothetical protein
MRSNRQTTSQTTCDHEDSGSTRCHAYASTAFYQQTAPAEQAAKHAAALATDGWTDVEGRDCRRPHAGHPQDPRRRLRGRRMGGRPDHAQGVDPRSPYGRPDEPDHQQGA